MQTPEHFTLKQVTDSIRKTIAERYARTYWVTAEMHKLNATRKGHCYPELVQKEDDLIIVEIRGTIWKQQYERIQQRFTDIVKEPLRDGMELLFLVKINYHPIYNIGLEILDIDPNYTLGALQRERQETLERLHREGILTSNQQLKMATVPKRLAILSQADSKGYSDFVTLLNGHPKKYHFSTFLFETTLQGDAAISAIQNQLHRIEKVKHHFDAVVIIRGGGGEVGMHCYNNYELSKAIALFPLPILTGIGHSTNLTVCEMIAYRNGITPSDMAYLLLSIFESLDQPLDDIAQQLPALTTFFIEKSKLLFDRQTRTMKQLIQANLVREQTKFQQQIQVFEFGLKHVLSNAQQSIEDNRNQLRLTLIHRFETIQKEQLHAQNLLGIHTKNRLSANIQVLQQITVQLKNNTPRLLGQHEQQLAFLERTAQLVDPRQILKRGFAIVTNKNGIINASNPALIGSGVTITTAENEINSIVESINEIVSNTSSN
jgi:exodeoxyribonuclease VII large subunit